MGFLAISMAMVQVAVSEQWIKVNIRFAPVQTSVSSWLAGRIWTQEGAAVVAHRRWNIPIKSVAIKRKSDLFGSKGVVS